MKQSLRDIERKRISIWIVKESIPFDPNDSSITRGVYGAGGCARAWISS